ncbi:MULTISPECIES: hypothetical protein [Spongiibacter]|uniref:hypothetical protein n=1 Tax=Spongiibacter TaxID=630749 RepID=UPI001B1C14B6|nr:MULTISPECIES: hypothetical protein [Spongiibacter]MBO6752104.1 hypothetical protein [Spongiibacter sp.]
MADEHYDLFLTGQLAVGADRERAVQQLAALFKRPPEQMAKLLQGRTSRIRKNLDAEQLQRLQRGFDKLGILTESRPSSTTSPQQQAIEQHAEASEQALSLSPVGSPVLREQERRRIDPVNVDISGLRLDALGAPLQPPSKPAAHSPDTSHLQIAPQDDGTPLSQSRAVPKLDLDELCGHLSLAERPAS